MSDCVEGFLIGAESGRRVATYNINSMDRVTILEIAERVKRVVGCSKAEVVLTGGVDGSRG